MNKKVFEEAYQNYLNASANHLSLFTILSRLSVLAGLIYNPEQDADMDSQLEELSRQVFVLGFYEQIEDIVRQSRSVGREENNGNVPLDKIFESLQNSKLLPLSNDYRANYPKILGWVIDTAKARNILE